MAMEEIPIPEDGAILRVRACGVARSDALLFRRGARALPGHEIVGDLVRGMEALRARWGIAEGGRVLAEPYAPCHACSWCARGEYGLCDSVDAEGARRIGLMEQGAVPALSGGFAEYLALDDASVLHAVPEGVDDALATLAHPFANGWHWAVTQGGAAAGKTVLVLGAGPEGLGALLAARRAGAGVLLAAQRAQAPGRALAHALGAAEVAIIEDDDLADWTRAHSGGRGADAVIDATPDTSGHVAAAAIAAAAKGGTLVLGGTGTVPFPLGPMRRRYLTLRPARGHDRRAVEAALAMIAAERDRLAPLGEALFPLARAGEAIAAFAAGTAVHPVVLPFA
jgi:(R,R)-butanediol dehydrogenase/meso-butanediol dehydrogenase/diacetyl reductase